VKSLLLLKVYDTKNNLEQTNNTFLQVVTVCQQSKLEKSNEKFEYKGIVYFYI